MERFVARNSRWRIGLLLAMAIGFVAFGAWLAGLLSTASDAGMHWAGWLLIMLFGAGALLLLPRLFDSEPRVEITRLGIRSRDWSDDLIPWSEIAQVSLWQFRGNRTIMLRLRDPVRFPSTRPLGKLGRFNRILTRGDVGINMGALDRSTDEALATIACWIPDKLQA